MSDMMSYVINSRNRPKVLKSLAAHPKMPSEIERDVGSGYVSNTLRQLKDHDLVECINPEVKKGRLYRLTDEGRRIVCRLGD